MKPYLKEIKEFAVSTRKGMNFSRQFNEAPGSGAALFDYPESIRYFCPDLESAKE